MERRVALGTVQFSSVGCGEVRYGLAVNAFNVMLCFVLFSLFFVACYFRINLYNKLSTWFGFFYLRYRDYIHQMRRCDDTYQVCGRKWCKMRWIEYEFDNDNDSDLCLNLVEGHWNCLNSSLKETEKEREGEKEKKEKSSRAKYLRNISLLFQCVEFNKEIRKTLLIINLKRNWTIQLWNIIIDFNGTKTIAKKYISVLLDFYLAYNKVNC